MKDKTKVADPSTVPGELETTMTRSAGFAPEAAAPGRDPIGCELKLPLTGVFYPLGFSVEIATNCADVLALAHENWRSLQQQFAMPPVQLRIAVSKERASECPPPPTCRGQRNLVMFVASAHDFAVCDLTTGFASCWLSESTVESCAYVRYHFLDAMALLLIEAMYLTPIHAACVSLNGRGLLLCGDSGAGKSSLSYACARRGWTFVSDDSSFLVRGGKGNVVVGSPYHLHFRESATELFAELKSHELTARINGEIAIELATAIMPHINTAPQSQIDFLIFLNRGPSGSPALQPFSKGRASVMLEQVICYGEPHLRDAQKSALQELLCGEVLELQYSGLDSAVDCLECLLRSETTAAAKSQTPPSDSLLPRR